MGIHVYAIVCFFIKKITSWYSAVLVVLQNPGGLRERESQNVFEQEGPVCSASPNAAN